MAKHKICIDLGTTNTLIWVDSSSSVIFNEPTMIAINNLTKEVVEIGYLAAKMLGRTPYNIDIVAPLKDGVVADLDATIKFIEQAFKNIKLSRLLKGSEIFLATPSDVTAVEQQAILGLATSLGAKSITVDSEARMAAIGSGIDIFSPHGAMVVDIGGGTTDVAVIALGEVVKTRAIHVAGNSINTAIQRYLRTKNHLLIGEKTAEYIKMKSGTVFPQGENQLLEVNGRDVITGLPHSLILSDAEIAAAIIPQVDMIADLIKEVLEETPAELSSDIARSGITLCGGGSLLSGLRQYLERKLMLPVHLTPYPLETVVSGLVKISSEPRKK